MASNIVCQEFNQGPSDTRYSPFSHKPQWGQASQKYNMTCALKDDPANFSLDKDDTVVIDGVERRQGYFDFEKGYCNGPEVKFEYYDSGPQDDPLFVGPNYIKQEFIQEEEFIIVDEEDTQVDVGEDEYLSSNTESLMKVASKGTNAPTTTVDSENTATSTDNNPNKLNECANRSSANVYFECDFEKHKTECNKGNPYKCTVRRNEPTLGQSSRRHLRAGRTKVKRYKCKLCSFGTDWFASFRRHMNTHPENQRYECELCPFSAKYANEVRTHMRTHAENSAFKCALCPYSTRYDDSLREHMRTHSEKKPYKCALCPFTSRYSTCLRGHMVTHSDEKPFKCSLCTFSSKYARSLQNHVSAHSGFKPFQCTVCPYSTGWANALKGHVATHLRGKPNRPFQCAHCKQTFFNKLTLTEHITNRHL